MQECCECSVSWRCSYSLTDQPLRFYSDLAYPMRLHHHVPYQGARLSNNEQSFNTSTSTVRTTVEWVFGDITSYFAFLDFKKNLKIGLSPTSKMYAVCALLRNAVTCPYGSSTSSYFNVPLQGYCQV